MYRGIKDLLVETFTDYDYRWDKAGGNEKYTTIRWTRVLFALSCIWLVGTCIYLAYWAFANYPLAEIMQWVGVLITLIAGVIVFAVIVGGDC